MRASGLLAVSLAMWAVAAGPVSQSDGTLIRRADAGERPRPAKDLHGYPEEILNPSKHGGRLYPGFTPMEHDVRYPFRPPEAGPRKKGQHGVSDVVNICIDQKWLDYSLFSRMRLNILLGKKNANLDEIADYFEKWDWIMTQNIPQQCIDYYKLRDQGLEKYFKRSPVTKEAIRRNLKNLGWEKGKKGGGEQEEGTGRRQAMILGRPEKAMQRSWEHLVENGKAAIGSLQNQKIGLPSVNWPGLAATVQRSVVNRPKMVRIPM